MEKQVLFRADGNTASVATRQTSQQTLKQIAAAKAMRGVTLTGQTGVNLSGSTSLLNYGSPMGTMQQPVKGTSVVRSVSDPSIVANKEIVLPGGLLSADYSMPVERRVKVPVGGGDDPKDPEDPNSGAGGGGADDGMTGGVGDLIEELEPGSDDAPQAARGSKRWTLFGLTMSKPMWIIAGVGALIVVLQTINLFKK